MKLKQILSVINELPYFSKQNLGLFIGKESENLNYWVKKLMREDLIIQVKKGLFVPGDLRKRGEDDLYSLANVLRYPSYVSLESVLSKNGIIPETAFAITSVTTKSSRIFRSKIGLFIYRTVKPELFYGFKAGKPKIAGSAKALFDFLYLKKFDSTQAMKKYLLEEGRINWLAMSPREMAKFARIVNDTKLVKMQKILAILKKERIC